MQVAPGARRSRVEQLGIATRVSIPSRLNAFGGAEVITVSPGSLTIRLAAFGLGQTWEYDSSQIRALRVVPNYVGPQRWSGSEGLR